MASPIVKVLSATRLFGVLPPEDLTRLEPEFEWVRVPGGETLFEQGEAGDCLYIVASGRIEVFVTKADGTASVIGEAGAGDVLGEMALLTGEKRAATARSLRDSALLRLSDSAFDKLLESMPRLMRVITRRIVEHYQRALRRPAGASGAASRRSPSPRRSATATRRRSRRSFSAPCRRGGASSTSMRRPSTRSSAKAPRRRRATPPGTAPSSSG